ncbi:MAG: M60 family metallopeptidase [Fimbriimonadaceae bacterium]
MASVNLRLLGYLAAAFLLVSVAHASGSVSVTLGQKGGWMPDGWGSLNFKLVGGDAHARLEKWEGHWVVGSQTKDAIGEKWTGDGVSRSTIGYLRQAYVDAAKPGVPRIVGMVTIFDEGREHAEPFAIDVPGAVLPEPLVIHAGHHVGFAFQRSRWPRGDVPATIMPMMDTAYERMVDLTGVAPYGGKVIVLQESPPNPYWAYAGNPVILNGDYVAKTLKEATEGRLPFGWIHEMGHDFDVNGDWYIWNGAAAEFQANFKLGYVVEQPISGFRMVWDGYSQAAYPVAGGTTDSDGYQFSDSFFLFFGDPYLADPTRKWDSLTSDETHSFFLRLVRVYGWAPFKRWYRDYAALVAKGFKPPKRAETKIALCCGLLSKETGVDLAQIFRRWRYPVTDATVAAVMARYMLDPGVTKHP